VPGVDFVLLAYGEESMVTKMLYKKEDDPPSCRHPNEQSGYVVSGRYRMTIGGVGQVLDFFSSPRKDYL
jgi:quercetin dioxygenase-like cupin family protein